MKPLVLLSGGSRGLGLAFAKHLIQQGYAVSTFSRRATDEAQILAEAQPDCFQFAQLDLMDAEGLSKWVDAQVQSFGRPYAVINNSAIAVEGILATLPEVEIANMLAINLDGAIRLSRLALRHMLKKNQPGRIVNISSIVGQRGYNGLSVYSACKAGLDGFTRSLAREVGRRGVTVNSIAPGYMKTDMSMGLSDGQLQQIINRTPLGRLATVDDISPLLGFLLSNSAAFITGQTITVDGGISS